MFFPEIETDFCARVTKEYYCFNTDEYNIINCMYKEYFDYFNDFKIDKLKKEIYMNNITVLVIRLFDYYENLNLIDRLRTYSNILEVFTKNKDYIVLKLFSDFETIGIKYLNIDIDYDLISNINYRIINDFDLGEIKII